jgi:hypothetical protein
MDKSQGVVAMCVPIHHMGAHHEGFPDIIELIFGMEIRFQADEVIR